MSNVKFYEVGGSIRDEILGLKSKDKDYAVEADSFESMRAAILDRGGEIFLETPQFFTIRAKVPSLGACDFVLCRKDGAYSDSRHPDSVSQGTILDDLSRRDFTVNAIAKAEDGTIIDPHGGTHDLRYNRLACVGDARTRFKEDGLRMLRAIRFHVTKFLWINPDIHKCLLDQKFVVENLKGVSVERIREELHKCFAQDSFLTMKLLSLRYGELGYYIFTQFNELWLKPTLENR